MGVWNIMKEMACWLILPVFVGIISGGLVNYLADTLPQTRRLSAPGCPRCGTAYPFGAYVLVRPCGKCGYARGARAWIIQACMLVLSLYTWLMPHRMGYAAGMFVLTYFALVVVVDVEHRLILHPTSLFGALLGLSLGVWLRGVVPTVLGALAGLGILSVLYLLGMLFSRLRANRLRRMGQDVDDEEALGVGDVILAGVLGLMLGWPLIWFGVLLGVLLGGLLGAALLVISLVRGRYGKQALMMFMPYGPALVLSTFFILFVPSVISALIPK
jgi:prepilin signal peptidase PulO-like enzyme (type II secretory pathway)